MVFPYLKGLVIIKWWFSILFHISCVVIVFRYIWIYCDILYSGLWFLTSGIRALSLAGVVGNYFLFLQIFFFGEEGHDVPEIFSIFLYKIYIKGCISEFLSEKYPI